ncbi:Mitochondrial pyruvate carrier 2 [Smittium culicis]|uniref:Mitochondrial pyruvate carrier n=2 Tax=Smittium culicis TaxID=133412 RepID=A0A1R1YNI0_9FUNG|nr:Mitochondrial pyruvate carrier 2 [Smittium culicis]
MSGAAYGGASGKFRQFFNSPIGPKTVHFWAPLIKWSLVFVGLGDLKRPIEQVSTSQQTSLAVSGFIWARWCTIIKPKNYPLAAVNFFVGVTGAIQLFRIGKYNMGLKAAASKPKNLPATSS